MHPLAVAEAAEIGFREADREMRRLGVVSAADHRAVLVEPGKRPAVTERHLDAYRVRGALEPGGDQR